MKGFDMVDGYLKTVKEELVGVDKGPIIEEISAHIEEKANDISGKNGPDESVYRRVLRDLGSPDEVARQYLKEMPLKLPISLKLFLLFQLLTGLGSLLVFIEGMDTLLWAMEWHPDDSGFIMTQAVTNLLFLLISIVVVSIVVLQWKRPHRVASVGNLGAIISISAVIAIIFVMFRIIMFGIWGVEYSDESYYPIGGVVMIGFIVIYILGIQATERFNRRIYLSDEFSARLRRDGKRTRAAVLSISSILVVLLVLVALGQSMFSDDYYESDEMVASEYVGGPNNATLEHWEHKGKDVWYDYYRIKYDANGKEYDEWFGVEYRQALDWLRENGEEGDAVLSWWDYGHPIRGYTGLEPMIDSPHISMKHTLADPSKVSEWAESMEDIENVARALVTLDANDTVDIMEIYGARYVFTTQSDGSGILYALLQSAGLDTGDYIRYDPSGFYKGQTELGKRTVVNRMWRGEEIDGLNLVYSDLDARIYERIGSIKAGLPGPP
ncbi:MAG: hypothetical protein ACMUIE_02455 [Thermoplasmatota archaeon]